MIARMRSLKEKVVDGNSWPWGDGVLGCTDHMFAHLHQVSSEASYSSEIKQFKRKLMQIKRVLDMTVIRCYG